MHDPKTLPALLSRLAPRAVLLLIATTARAQEAEGGAPIPNDEPPRVALGVPRASFGTLDPATPDGRLYGAGPDYRAEFAPGRFEFLPALGSAAPETRPISFALEEILRGEERVHLADAAVRPALSGDRVAFQRGATIEERYDVRADGVHQSFVFSSKEELAGSGDLVVRGRLETALERVPAEDADGGLRFEVPGHGGVHWGAVTGIDADGRTVPGDLRLSGDVLELVLPASFVAQAAFPLVLDPLIGTTLEVSAGTLNDELPTAAFDTTEDLFLVVWQRWFAGNQISIRGQRMRRNGTLEGGLLFLSGQSSEGYHRNPSVANVNASNRFVVVWEETENVFVPLQLTAVAVDADDGGVSPKVALVPSFSNQYDAVLGGERTLVDDDALLVWEEAGTGLRMCQVTVPPSGAPYATGGVQTLHADTFLYTHSKPAISRSAGDTGHFLTTWIRTDGNGHREIEAQVVTRNASLVGSEILVSTGETNLENLEPAVDGDGERWIVAWRRSETLPTGKTDVVGRALERSGSVLSAAGNLSYVEADFDDVEFGPSVAWTGDAALVAYVDLTGDQSQVFVKVVDPFTCATCLPEMYVYGTTDQVWTVEVASQWSGGDVPGVADDALILVHSVWVGDLPMNDDDGDILAQLYDAHAAPIDLGGGSPSGGTNHNPCAYAGNANFRAQLVGAEPNAVTFFVASVDTLPIPCGSEVWLPSLNPAVVIIRITDAEGRASAQQPIPLGVGGMTVVTQWATLSPTNGCPSLGGYVVSNALQTPIAQ